MALAVDDQLREDDGYPTVARGVADVLLESVLGRRVDHELAALTVVGGGRLELLDVRAVARLGHREAPRKLERGGPLQVAFVMDLRAQLLDRAAPEPELHPELDQQG